MDICRKVSLEFGDFESNLSISYDDCVEFPSSWGLKESQHHASVKAVIPSQNENCLSASLVEPIGNTPVNDGGKEKYINDIVDEVQTDVKTSETFCDDGKSEIEKSISENLVQTRISTAGSKSDKTVEVITNGEENSNELEKTLPVDEAQEGIVKKVDTAVKSEVVNGYILVDDQELLISSKPLVKSNENSWASLFKDKMKVIACQSEETVNGHAEINHKFSSVSQPHSPNSVVTDHHLKDSNHNDIYPSLQMNPKQDPNAKLLAEALMNHGLKFKPQAFIPRGLINSSNWCYINATLQSLMMCPPFFQLFRDLPQPDKDQTKTSTPVINCFIRLASEFQPLSTKKGYQLTKEIRRGPPFAPECVYEMLTTTQSSLSENGSQEDAEEFLACVLNGLHDEMMSLLQLYDSSKTESLPTESKQIKNISPSFANDSEENEWEEVIKGKRNKSAVTRRADNSTTLVSEIFRGELCTCVGRAGQKLSLSREPFFSLPLAVPSHDQFWSVEDALYALTSRENIVLSESGKNVARQQFIEVLPPILILHLKRFVYNKNGGSKKIDRRMDFRSDLIIAKDLLSKSSKKYTLAERTYKLFAVVCHHGERATGGHYTADVFHIGVSSWLRIDDQKIHPVSHGEVTRHSQTRSPYLLYYRRTDLG